ncbi:MAG TPA: xanthine dehydrogenase family protein molybdopterin-binding subunit [Methylomirabilota bacterium]|jgi:carbon-monoxide dehydrogenase large subunit|nr:xanthine dehydrogenase family protein molybdopterin-binding subunit [Methylomirabilota bacterium]
MIRAVGRSVRRSEDRRLLTGRGKYAADFRLPRMLHGAVLRSPHAHARLGAIRARAALSLPGVVAVVTAEDLGDVGLIPVRLGPRPSIVACLQPPLARDKVRYVGEPVAFVVAESRYLAEDALEAMEVDYDPLPAVADARRALADGAPVLHEVIQGNVVATLDTQKGDAVAAMATAEFRVTERFSIQRHTGVPMETRGLTAAFDAGTSVLRLWGVAKVPHWNRRVLADLLRYPEHLIQFTELEVGGGFGVRGEFYPEDLLVPWTAMRLGRPVQWIEDRREHLMATNHSRQQWHEAEIGFDRDGRIVALVDRFITDMGAYIRTHGVVVPELTAALLPGPYRIPNYTSEIRCVLTNKTPTGTYRGPGRFECTFVRERLMDLAAGRLGVDPLELRRRNFITPAEMPYEVGGASLNQRTVYDCGDYASALDHALAALGHESARRQQAEARRQGRHVGIGVACLVEKAGLGPWEYARVEVDATGHVVVYSGVAAVGQGIATTLAQVCADELGVAPEQITVVHGDSARVPFGIGGFASRGASVALPAAMEAARKVRAKILRVAAALLEAAVDDLVLGDGAVHVRGVPDRSVTFSELARAAIPGPPGMEPGLHASHFFEAPKMTYPYGCHAAMVEVDDETGCVKILKYAIAYDIGKAVNPMIVDGQLVGALAQGLGGALLEELVYDEQGQLLTSTFMDYLVPTVMEMPDSTVVRILEETPTPLNPLGAKGAGEGGSSGCGGAIANAVADALGSLGVSITALPLSPDRLSGLIRAARKGAS